MAWMVGSQTWWHTGIIWEIWRHTGDDTISRDQNLTGCQTGNWDI